MLIDQENNIEHYPIAFNIFLLFPIPKKNTLHILPN